MERDLSLTRISALTKKLQPDQISTFGAETLTEVSRQVKTTVLDYNFDTFSLMFDLLQHTNTLGVSLSEAFVDYKVDSQSVIQKYGGSNCTGLSIELRDKLASVGILTYLAPSYGRYLLTQEADDYGQIRTVDLLGLARGKESEWVFLAPGLTLGKSMIVKDGHKAESFGNTFVISKVSDENFDVVTVKPNGDLLSRIFSFEELLNPDESVQKNLLRVRTKYQITRQYENGGRDFITFDFSQRKFKVSLKGGETMLDIDSFRNYVDVNSKSLEKRFRNAQLTVGLMAFMDNISSISQELLLPDLQAILAKIWKSS